MKSKKNKVEKPNRTKAVLTKVVAGVLIPAILLPSCSPYFLDENDVVKINNQDTANNSIIENLKNSIAVPIDLKEEDMRFLEFLEKLVTDILENPQIARELASSISKKEIATSLKNQSSESITKTYGVEDLNIDFDDALWKLIVALGDEDLHSAVMTQDIPLFFSLCESRGLITELDESEIVKYYNDSLKGANVTMDAEFGIVLAAVVAVVAVAAGGIAVTYIATRAATAVEAITAAVVRTTLAVSGAAFDESVNVIMTSRDPQAYQMWILKNGKENTRIILTEYQEKIINDCVEILFKYYPEKAAEMDIEKFRQLVALNLL